jgi:hypothetical protein
MASSSGVTVFMYTIYSDLIGSAAVNAEQSLNIQKPRDAILRRAMVAANLRDFPMPDTNAEAIFPFFQEKTRSNPVLNILLIYKKNGNEINYVIIHNGEIQRHSTRQAAFDSVTQAHGSSYSFIKYKIDP